MLETVLEVGLVVVKLLLSYVYVMSLLFMDMGGKRRTWVNIVLALSLKMIWL